MERLLPPVPDSVSESVVEVADGVTLRVLRAGSGTPIVFIPGWTCTADFFVHQLTGLSDRYDVIAYDPRGHGKSSKPTEGNTFTQHGKDLAVVLDALGLEKVALAGWSFGMFDALAYVRDFGTGRVSSLLLVDESPKVPAMPGDPDAWGEAVLAFDGIVAFLQAMVNDRLNFWIAYSSYMLGLPEDTSPDHPDVARVVELGMQAPEYVAVGTGADGLTADFSETAIAAAQEVPTIFIVRDDWADTARNWVTKNVPVAAFATMPTHMGFVVDPEGFNRTVAEFVG